MGKGKPRHNPDKPQNNLGKLCKWAETYPHTDYIYCERGYSAYYCKGDPHKCNKAWFKSLARRSDKQKNLDMNA